MSDMIKKIKNTIADFDMLQRGDCVVVAVSGGPDSVCLLHVLYMLRDVFGIHLVVAHFDHGLRPDRDEDETMFVESLARRLKLPFETGKAIGLADGSGSLEERARGARYEFFEDIRARYSAQKIALGHNLNDQAETVFMRFLRGSGISGLSGMPPKRGDMIIRPLIEISRDEIESYLMHNGLTYVTDLSNFDKDYLRNRIRLEIMPLLREYQPRIIEIMARTACIMREEDEPLDAQAKKWLEERISIAKDGTVSISLSSLLSLHKAFRTRVLRSILKMTAGSLRRIGRRHMDAIDGLLMGNRSQAQVCLPYGTVVRKVYCDLVSVRENAMEYRDLHYSYSLDGPGTYFLDAVGRTISIEEITMHDILDVKGPDSVAFLNADLIDYPLVARNFRPGDKFIPFGMNGHKKLKDFFIDLKIPSEIRKKTPVLTCGEMIIWVCGLRIDDRFKITKNSKRILKVKLI